MHFTLDNLKGFIGFWLLSRFFFICWSQEFFLSKFNSFLVYFQGYIHAKPSPWLFLSRHFQLKLSISSFMSAISCLEMGQTYWLVIAAASLASLSKRLLGGKKWVIVCYSWGRRLQEVWQGHLVKFKDGSKGQMYDRGTQIMAACSQAPHKCTGKPIGVIVPIYSRHCGQEVLRASLFLLILVI